MFRYSDQRMAKQIVAHDWSGTAIGAPDGWPPALRTILDLMMSSKFPMFAAWGPDLIFLYNDAYAPMLGAKEPTALGRPFSEVWSDIWVDILPLVEGALAGRATWMEDLPLVMHRSGYPEQTYWTFSYSAAHDDSGAIAGMFCACQETTGRVESERTLKQREETLAEAVTYQRTLLDEKDILLAEVNHRVKNSLQLVVSALNLQSRRVTDAATKVAFEQAITRVKAITSVHERLYKSASPLVVEMPSYLDGLVADLVDGSELQDRIAVECDHIELKTERAIPIALIVNELITNVLKYAYPPGRPGPVTLKLKASEGGLIVLSVSDEGTGMSSTTTTGGLGTRLIDTMAGQLGGTIDRQIDERGYSVSVTFPKEEV
ncbi:sensor histidine kinase [uncultured Aureimonas sp.]|uniref:sensor histidine kinase n=1 Tax=uncultured Aureimonas sp. TaxID=1604662 RepID=UPI0025E6C2C6|nr:PAS domain-containing sensor histidine kinase [uncultured Aureimonas sp.]